MSEFDLIVVVVGSVDGELARQDFAENIAGVDTWYNFSLSWDSRGLDLSQTVTLAIGADNPAGTAVNVMFVVDSVSLSASGPPGTVLFIR